MPKRDRKVDPITGEKLVYGIEFYRVSSMPCCVCGGPGWWAHHVVPVGRGGEDHFNVVPMCVKHHTEIEDIGAETFADKYDVDLNDVALVVGKQRALPHVRRDRG